jgi:hypothetical protein
MVDTGPSENNQFDDKLTPRMRPTERIDRGRDIAVLRTPTDDCVSFGDIVP